jgi:hypothetical protein
MAGNPSADRWDLTNWVQGPVTLFQAFGIKKGTVELPKLQTQLTGAAASALTQNSSASSKTNSGTSSATGPVNGCTEAQTAANKKLGQQLAHALGWDTGSEWDSLNNLVMGESGWCNVAQNPNSTAYGIGQFLDTTWASTGYSKTSDSKTQILAMLLYIKLSYGTPSNAWAKWQARSPHWY